MIRTPKEQSIQSEYLSMLEEDIANLSSKIRKLEDSSLIRDILLAASIFCLTFVLIFTHSFF
jgi:hypothetical protein